MDGTRQNLTIGEIGYYGKRLDTLNKDELIGFCLQLAQAIYECSNGDTPCREVFPLST